MTWNDPKLYREMSVPHETMDAAMAEAAAFTEGLKELRQRHRIPDLYVVAEMNAISDDGSEKGIVFSLGIGNSSRHEVLAARALGIAKAERSRQIDEALQRKDVE
jgi:hypothetical protein